MPCNSKCRAAIALANTLGDIPYLLSTAPHDKQPLSLVAHVNGTLERPHDVISLSQAECAVQHSRSQNNEDLLLLPTLMLATRGAPGVFVEIGALDGLSLSNSYMLEKCFNWTGLLIEGNRNSRAYLRAALSEMWPTHSWLAERGFTFKPTAKQLHEAIVKGVRAALARPVHAHSHVGMARP